MIRLYPQEDLFAESVSLLRDSTPLSSSAFLLKRTFNVPWTANTTTFILETDEPNAVHTITINRTNSLSIVPGQKFYTLALQLSKGPNRIEVRTNTQSELTTVAATAVQSWFHSLGREYYLSVGQRLEDIQAHFRSPWTTRAAGHLLPYNDLFLPARMPKIQQTRFAISTSVGGRLGHGDGVKRVATALSYSTPYVSKAFESEYAHPGKADRYPVVTTHPTTGGSKGRVFDLWTPNVCLATLQALFRFSLSQGAEDVPEPKPLEVVDKTDRALLLRENGGEVQFHNIDPLSGECDDVIFNTSCDQSRVFASFENTLEIMMLGPQIPLDGIVDSPINFGFFDSGNFFDGSTGTHTDPGLGGGTTFDNVDPIDPHGDGFEGYSLSRRLDGSGCLDTRVSVGSRISQFVSPISGTTGFTPEPPIVEGTELVVDTSTTGAPSSGIGDTTIWAHSDRYLYEGDLIRFENPDQENFVVSAWPVYQGADFVVKSDSTVTYTPSGVEKILTGPAGFFEKRYENWGIQVGTDLFSIVRVSDDGTQCTITGNPAIPGGGALVVNIYRPLRDANDDSEPDASVMQDVAGNVVYEIELSVALIDDLDDRQILSYRPVPRSFGATSSGSATLNLVSDTPLLPGDLLYFDSGNSVAVLTSYETMDVHPTTGHMVYAVTLDGVTPAAYSSDEGFLVVRKDPCWPNGAPVTPLSIISLAPSTTITY